MSPERWTRVQAIFLDAEVLPPERREGLLSQLCAGDAALRSEVEALLSASADTVGVLDRPPATGSAATAESLGEHGQIRALARMLGRDVPERMDRGHLVCHSCQ